MTARAGRYADGVAVVGIDLAWGETRHDGVCAARLEGERARILGFAHPHGDDALVETVAAFAPPGGTALLAIDAPIVCPNATGSRPVDLETTRLFGRFHAGAHPANATRCRRPPRVLARLRELGFAPGWTLSPGGRVAAEVYPHPAMVRMLRLDRIVKYKRGRVAARRLEFARLQRLLVELLARDFPWLEAGEETAARLAAPWSKRTEDEVDALFCALLGLWHARWNGERSEVLGDLAAGFTLLPRPLAP